VAAGLCHIDSAHTYTGGDSEETIGAALSPLPEGCVVATKGGWSTGRPDVLRAEIEESLTRRTAIPIMVSKASLQSDQALGCSQQEQRWSTGDHLRSWVDPGLWVKRVEPEAVAVAQRSLQGLAW
jgi:hypothetical protein